MYMCPGGTADGCFAIVLMGRKTFDNTCYWRWKELHLWHNVHQPNSTKALQEQKLVLIKIYDGSKTLGEFR